MAYSLPALIALLPSVALWTSGLITWSGDDMGPALLLSVLFAAGTVLLKLVVWSQSDRLQKSMFSRWRDRSGVHLLRHRDRRIDPETKVRYHKFLEKRIHSPFPTPDEEDANPERADEIYAAGFSLLINHFRHQDRFRAVNAPYGAYLQLLNNYAIQKPAITFAVLMALTIVGLDQLMISRAISGLWLGMMPRGEWLGIVFCVALALVRSWLFTEDRIREAEVTWSSELLTICDAIDQPRSPISNT